MDKIDKALSVAISRFGTRELTGKNDGPFIDEVLKLCGLDNGKYLKATGRGYAWCAGFVSWVLTQVDSTIKPNAWAPSWFPESRLVKDGKYRTMDVAAINYNDIANGHVFFILEYPEEGDYFLSLDGNWGNCVGVNLRKKSDLNNVSRWL